jgi:O-methyltransferase domain/Dimerisation domain
VTDTATPVTEPRADEAIRLHRLMTGYLSSRALFSALELGVFDALAIAPGTAEEIGARIGLAGRPARILLLALEGEGLVTRTAGRYANTTLADTFLVSSSPRCLSPLGAHQAGHFAKLVHLTQALRDNLPVHASPGYTGEFQSEPTVWARRWAEVMRASSQLMAEDLAGAAPLQGHRHLVDLGCASAAYSIALARANPDLRITAVDQPAIAEVARDFVAQAGLADRIDVRPGNIFTDAFPECDVALLSHVIQGFAAQRAYGLLQHVYEWLPRGGELLIHSHLPERARVPFPYQFGLILLANNTQGGEAHTEELTREWLARLGLRDVTVREVSPISALVRAAK